MLQKQVVLTKCCGVAIASLLLLSGCGEKKTKPNKKTKTPIKIDKNIRVVKTGKVKIKTTNVAINPSFEKAEVFNSGLYKKGKTPLKRPVGWTTKNQILNDADAWVSDEAHTGKRSLKIKNIGGTDAYWEGKPIVLTQEANSFEVGIWTKAKQIAKNTTKGKFQLVFAVYEKNANGLEVIGKTVYVDIPKANHDWKKTSKKILVGEKISRIVPYIYFSGTAGTVWIDDLDIKPHNEKGRVLFDSNADVAFTGKYKIISDSNNKKIYQISGYKMIFNSKFIPVDSNKAYRLSGMFKSATGGSELYFGYAPYSKNKELITRSTWKYIDNTETELAKACKAEDTVLYIKNNANWVRGGKIAFAVDTSGKYSDLPNFNLSWHTIDKISKRNDIWEIKLSGACGKSFPAKTKIREHAVDGQGTYMYHVANNMKVPEVWTEYSGVMQKYKNKLFGKFYPGTKYVKILIYQNSVKRKNILVDFKDIKLVEFDHQYDDAL